MDWFTEFVGVSEKDAKFECNGDWIKCLNNGKEWFAGSLITPRLGYSKVWTRSTNKTRSKISVCSMYAEDIHLLPESHNSVIQVASQTNLLEMVSPSVTPDHVITRYENDLTQGPACAISTGSGILFRHYFVGVNGQNGQSARNQLNMWDAFLASNSSLSKIRMQNGYAMFDSFEDARNVEHILEFSSKNQLSELRDLIKVGVHMDMPVTLRGAPNKQAVTHVLCSAFPVRYNRFSSRRLTRLVLESAYETTLRFGSHNYDYHGNPIVYLTLVGGGAFGNKIVDIIDAMKRAYKIVEHDGLDIRIVCPVRCAEVETMINQIESQN